MTSPQPNHPAKFSQPILDRLRVLLATEAQTVRAEHGRPLVVLDPFAGVGRIHRLARPDRIATLGLELEAEWAACHRDTIHTDALVWMSHAVAAGWYDVVATSPTYGNRFSDHHVARDGSTRRSYTHDLGRQLTANNSGTLTFGTKYWEFHALAWQLVFEVLRPGGLFLLNVSNFYRGETIVDAVTWHRGAAWGAGFVQGGRDRRINTPRLQGVGDASTAQRAEHEVILVFRKPELRP